MALRNGSAVPFTPTGLTDSIDPIFDGACLSLANLMFDRKNRGAVIPRPGVVQSTSFPGFTVPGVVSGSIAVGSRIFGTVGSNRNIGFDEPFCYDTASNSFVIISGITSSNVPATPAISGAWTPPTMDVIGTRVVVTHPGFSGANFFGWFDTGGFSATPTATTTSASPILTAVSATTSIVNGMTVTGAGIPANSVVLSTTVNTITISQNATASAAGITISVSGGTAAAPAWGAGNTGTNPLPSIPIWVAQFTGRAYFGCKNVVYFSDQLNALNISNTNFAGALTLGDTTSTTGSSGLAFSTSSAGILQSLVVFKSNTIYQVSGDIAFTGNQALSQNLMSSNIGCNMPRTAQSTPYGVIFIANDGPRLVDLRGQIQYLTNDNESVPNLLEPFANATTPSRACSGYNNSIYRVSLDTNTRDTSNAGVAVAAADYWYDFLFSRWNGRHSFKYNSCVAVGSTFYVASNSLPGFIFLSDVVPSTSTIYLDNGSNYMCSILSSVLPIGEPMSQKAVVESTIELSNAPFNTPYAMNVYDDQFIQLSQCIITVPGSRSAWGTGIWNSFVWGSPAINNHVYTMAWPNPIVFKKMIFSVSTIANQNVSIRKSNFRYQQLGYVNA